MNHRTHLLSLFAALGLWSAQANCFTVRNNSDVPIFVATYEKYIGCELATITTPSCPSEYVTEDQRVIGWYRVEPRSSRTFDLKEGCYAIQQSGMDWIAEMDRLGKITGPLSFTWVHPQFKINQSLSFHRSDRRWYFSVVLGDGRSRSGSVASSDQADAIFRELGETTYKCKLFGIGDRPSVGDAIFD